MLNKKEGLQNLMNRDVQILNPAEFSEWSLFAVQGCIDM